jgi:aminoglycoside phosphotransferase (APT) family kinase protein
MTLEAPVPELAAATRGAADFIVRMHRATARPERLTPARVDALTGPLFDTAHARYPLLREALARLRAGVRASLEGRVLPLVWMHGDFKVENVVVDRGGAVVGVIDWELSEPEALPLLDMGFLLLYNVTIRRGEQFLPGVRSLYPPMRVPDEERALWDAYLRALGIAPAAVPGLVGALFVHHMARRMFYDSQNAANMSRLAGLIDELLEWHALEGSKA